MTLSSCLKKAGGFLPESDKAALLSRALQLSESGIGPELAADQAVVELLRAVQAQLDVGLQPASLSDPRPATLSTPREPAVGDQTDIGQLPQGDAVPATVATGSLQAARDLARSKVYGTGRALKVDLQARVLSAALAAKVDLSAHTQENVAFLTGMVVADARLALQDNANAVGWYDKTVSRAMGALATIHPEIDTDASARLAFLWALATTSNGLRVGQNFKLAESTYRQWRQTGIMPTNVGIGNAAGAINKGLGLFNDLSVKLGTERLAQFMATQFEVGQIKGMLGLEAGGEWMPTPVLGAAILGPKIGNGFFSNLNGYFDALTIDRWLMRTWGRMTGTLIQIDAAEVARQRASLAQAIASMTTIERRSMSRLVARPVRQTLSRVELDQLSVAVAKSSMKPDRRSQMAAATATDQFRRAGNNLAKVIDGQKEAPANPAERNFMRAVFRQALDRLNAGRDAPDKTVDMTMSDLQALLWYPERRLYDAAKSDEAVSDGYADDEAPDYANAAYDLAHDVGISQAKIRAAMSRAEARGTVQGQPLSIANKQRMLREFKAPPAQSSQLAFELVPGLLNPDEQQQWRQLTLKERTRITKQVRADVVADLASAIGVKTSQAVEALGAREGFVDPHSIAEYKHTQITIAEARALSAALGAALNQPFVTLVDPRASQSTGLIRITLTERVDRHVQALLEAIQQQVPQIQNFSARGNNFDILNVTDESTEEISRKIDIALRGMDADFEATTSHGVTQSETINKESYESYINGLQPGSGRAIFERIERAHQRAVDIAAAGIAGSDRAGALGSKRPPADSAGASRTITNEPGSAGVAVDAGQRAAERPGAPPVLEPGAVRRSSGRLADSSGPNQSNGRPRAADGSLHGLPAGLAGHFARAEQVARAYMARAKLPYSPPTTYVKVDLARAARVAQAYDDMQDAPYDPAVQAAYAALSQEVQAQYDAVLASGLRVEFIDLSQAADPYAAGPRMAIEDVRNNNHLWVFSTREGYGGTPLDAANNPMAAETAHQISGQVALVNDLFRVVHDYFGHVKEGVGFRADGEENAWRAHVAMFSPLAARAVTTETRGQNSWVNFGPYGPSNRLAQSADTRYAPQKIGLMPPWATDEAASDKTGNALLSTSRPMFYSQLEKAFDGVPDRLSTMAAPQWRLWLDANAGKLGVKKDEIEWSGVKDYLTVRGKEKVTRDELAQYMQTNGVKVGETALGAPQRLSKAEEVELTKLEGMDRRVGQDMYRMDELLTKSEGVPSKYSEYTVPGGKNYRELLITLPAQRRPVTLQEVNEQRGRISTLLKPLDQAEYDALVKDGLVVFVDSEPDKASYQSPHFNQPNILAHLRVDDRVDADGKKTLFIHEVQSDWGQQGKKQGFNAQPDTTGWTAKEDAGDPASGPTWAVRNADGYWIVGIPRAEVADAAAAIARAAVSGGRAGLRPLPSAPFVTDTKSWTALALKRAIIMAANEGYDKVAFINGEQAAGLYSLDKQVDELVLYDDNTVVARQGGSKVIQTSFRDDNELADIVGKDVAAKLLATQRDMNSQRILRGNDLKVEAAGMRRFYDAIIPQVARDVLKKLGGDGLESIRVIVNETPRKITDQLGFDESEVKFARRNNMWWATRNRTETTKADLGVYWTGSEWSTDDGAQRWFSTEAEARASVYGNQQQGFTITPAMREHVSAGLPLFSPSRPQENMPIARPKNGRLSLGANEAVMHPRNVVGRHQGGRFADDISPGTVFDAQAAFEKHGGDGDVDDSAHITAKSEAFADMAEAAGYNVVGRGDKYVVLTKDFGNDKDGYTQEAIIKVRISDHSNVNRGVHFGDSDINIAPDDGYSRDTFAQAWRKIKSAYVNDASETVIPAQSAALDGHLPPQMPAVVYHGSPVFRGDQSVYAGVTRPFWVTGDPVLAESYARGGQVTAFELKIQRPANLTQMAPQFLDLYNSDSEMLSDNPDAAWDTEVDGEIADSAYLMTNSPLVMQALLDQGYDSVTVEERPGVWSYGILDSNHIARVQVGGLVRSARRGQTSTPEFVQWFGDSKVVDADGKPLQMYHGTSKDADFKAFKTGQRGSWFSSSPVGASQYAQSNDSQNIKYEDGKFVEKNTAQRVMPVYLSIQNPYTPTPADMNKMRMAQNYAAAQRQVFNQAVAKGFDGVDMGDGVWVAMKPEQIKSSIGNNGRFDAAKGDITKSPVRDFLNKKTTRIVGETSRTHTPEQLAAMRNVGFQVEEKSITERVQDITKGLGKRLTQGIVDQFAPIKDLDMNAYTLTRLSKGASGAFEAFLKGGNLKLNEGVYDFDETKKGGVIDRLLIPLQGEHHDFFRWVAANRAERLMTEDKEHLFSADDIAALKTLSTGQAGFSYTLQHGPNAGKQTNERSAIYADSLKTFNQFNDNVLDMAEQSGLIDGEARHLWEQEFYVPFYRVADEMEGGVRGMGSKGSLVRQEAFKKLKGGKNALNADLLDNTMMNWAHLLDAAAKNRAAKATLESAERLGVAINASQETLTQMSKSALSKTPPVWYMEQGQKRHFLVEDPMLLTAISSLEYAGMRNPVMNAMGAFKHALTVGVTASPFFKIRNLIRDSVQAIGMSELSLNPIANVTQGWKLTDPKSDAYFRLLAGGGTIHFGTMMEGSEAKRVQALVESGVDRATILTNGGVMKAFYRKVIEPSLTAYNELGNRGEAVNRASLYDQLIKQGKGHAQASLMARDLMDFSLQGSFGTIRFLSQVVPFLNARLQGLYKLGRSVHDDPQRAAVVVGAVTLFSLSLLAAYGDDDDWKKREEFDRNNFWWFKLGGVAYRIPKPFEMGAVGTLAERGFEYMFDKEMTGKRLRGQVLTLLSDNLAMNPIPQLVKPIVDVYANKDSFSGRPIESLGMERLKSEYRFNDRTSMVARGLSTAANAATDPLGLSAPSPVQIDAMLRGYFGWLGSFVVSAADALARPATNQPSQARPDVYKLVTGGMVSDLRDAPSRYVTQMYEQARVVEQAYGTYNLLKKEGKAQEAAEFKADHQNELSLYRNAEAVKHTEARLNARAREVSRTTSMTPDEKREALRLIQVLKDAAARRLSVLP